MRYRYTYTPPQNHPNIPSRQCCSEAFSKGIFQNVKMVLKKVNWYMVKMLKCLKKEVLVLDNVNESLITFLLGSLTNFAQS